MTPDRWQQVTGIFHSALARDASAREAYLAEACQNDSALRAEVDALLAAHVEAGSFGAVPVVATTESPRLEPGTALGPYRIEALLGAGGMGEVYRARDTRLGRDVAVKILPPGVAKDPERIRRFEQEARAAAALNHANICTLHDIGEHDGTRFLLMELVEGQTLTELIPPDGLPLDRLLQFAVPLADAVGAAHARGIVHRDLKPANVMVTPEGRVKVLDFGLAKLKELVGGAEMTTMRKSLTGDGRILGTFAYMSPEQAEGRDLDHRSDIFSLGGLLYEMATGGQPFKGDTSASLISSILKDTPPSVSDVKPTLPRELARIIRRCLAKEPGRRYQSALDLRNELEEIEQELRSSDRPPGVVETHAPRRRLASRALIAAAVVVAAVAIVLGYGAWRNISERTSPRVQRLPLQPPSGVRIAELGSESSLAISPDGQWIAFVGTSDDPSRWDLYLRSTSELDARLVPGGRRAWTPFFSPDSRWLGFFADDAIWKVPVGGGQPQRICPMPRLRGASWADDGTIVFSDGDGLRRVSAAGGEPVTLTSPEPGERHVWPQVLPGSQAALFAQRQGAREAWRKIAVVSLRTGKIIRTLVRNTGAPPRYLASGHLLYSRFGTLYAVGLDLERLEVAGEPAVVLEDVNFYEGSTNTAYDVASSGALVFIPGAPRLQDNELIWVDRQGRTTRAVEDRKPYRNGAAVAPDGDRVAVHISTTLEDSELWIYDISRGSWTN